LARLKFLERITSNEVELLVVVVVALREAVAAGWGAKALAPLIIRATREMAAENLMVNKLNDKR